MQTGKVTSSDHLMRDWVRASAAFGETAVSLAKVPLALTALGLQQWQLLFVNPMIGNRLAQSSGQPSAQGQSDRLADDGARKREHHVMAAPSRANAPGPLPKPAAQPEPDDLSQINGVGPAVQARLNALGVTRFDQIADWSDADIETMRVQLARLGTRIKSGDWRGQAQRLIAARSKGAANV